MALIALLAGAFAWKGNSLVQHYLLRSSSKTILRELETAHLLAMSYQSDIVLKIVNRKGDFFLEWETDEPALKNRCRSHKMRGVKNILADDKLFSSVAIAAFSSTAASSCKHIDLEGSGGESRRIEIQQGKPQAVQTPPKEEE